jgi:hypothetical protein
MKLTRVMAYVWAMPTTCVGLLFVGPTLLSGGRARVVDGVIELHGGAARFFLRRCVPLYGGAAAMTLGHVVLGCDRRQLERTRAHERVHVRQVERWGPLFLPAYAISSLHMLMTGRSPYRDNRFEREAFGVAG